ncbi:tRNA (adenine(58)-N(1))-methyltransferase, mitochondrial [Antennarius striatus]|uniref:tRNA (adenine(58)-N(1))-methyltransferase, mitochondrial n=1 Tax=Antennarius striatus TaxID=241820 RepID=UPI0035B36523
MTLKMPFPGLLFMHRLIRSSAITQRRPTNMDKLVKLNKCRWDIRTLSGSSVKRDENEGSETPLCTKMTFSEARQSRRRRPLSPLKRISGLLPPEALTPEVMQLREQNQDEDPNNQPPVTHSAPEDCGLTAVPEEDNSEKQLPSDGSEETHAFEKTVVSPTLPGERLLVFGELVVAEYYKKGEVEFRKMFQLCTGERLNSTWGAIRHDNMAGHPAGRFLKTSKGVPILIRRASLEDYVLYMTRNAAITLPKDACALLMMSDITEGDCVLETGSGSGGMSLFLSRAVGSKGSVVSVEIRKDHHHRAVSNYQRWRSSWKLRRGEEWPDNVRFHNADLCTAPCILAGQGFHAVILDMLNPHLALPVVLPLLHQGAVCTVYIVNVSQVIELLEAVRCLELPFLCERVIEVPLREWLVTAAFHKDIIRKEPTLNEVLAEDRALGDSDKEEMSSEKKMVYGSIPYIARPSYEQRAHSAFLVKLRKCIR